MITTKDIRDRINLDFGNLAPDVIKIFSDAISRAEYLNNDRLIRCILFLADRDLERLKKNIEAAIVDPRDVMLWAEYAHEQNGLKRIRDFSKTFEQADESLRE